MDVNEQYYDEESYSNDSSYNEDAEYEEYEPSEDYVEEVAQEKPLTSDDMKEFFETTENVPNSDLNKILEEPDFFKEKADPAFEDVKDPFTGKIIETQKDQHNFLTKYTEAVLRNAGLPSTYLDYRIKNHPAVLMASKVIETYETALSNHQFTTELNELKEIVPTINEMEDLFKMKNFKQFFNNYYGKIKVDKDGNPIGNPKPKMTMKEAYILANYDTVIKNKTTAGKQAVINNFRSKSHLSTLQNNKGVARSVDIPPETLELYKHLLPNLKMKDYMKHFTNNNNN